MVQAAEPRVEEAAPRARRAAGPDGAGGLRLSKHEASGNDFLVVVEPGPRWRLSAKAARALCDRRHGVGADGVLVATRGGPGADLGMTLVNADGSSAEMSGNGIGCLVQAAVDAQVVAPGRVRVETRAGLRVVDYTRVAEGVGEAQVAMGAVVLGDELPSPLPGSRARHAAVGNPHLVLVGDIDLGALDMVALAAAGEQLAGGPVNVEAVRAVGGARLALRVLERGAGETPACGTGSCAAAAVARSFGLVGAGRVEVENPGGLLEVELGPADEDPVVLRGTVRHVAEVVADPGIFDRG
jgi:diaminopimelate epimerase